MVEVSIIPYLEHFDNFLIEKGFKFQENTENHIFYIHEGQDFYLFYSPLSQELIFWIGQEIRGEKLDEPLEQNFLKAQKEFESLCWEFYLKYGKTAESILGSYLSNRFFNVKKDFANQKRISAPALIDNYSEMVEKYKKMPGMEKANFLEYYYKKVSQKI